MALGFRFCILLLCSCIKRDLGSSKRSLLSLPPENTTCWTGEGPWFCGSGGGSGRDLARVKESKRKEAMEGIGEASIQRVWRLGVHEKVREMKQRASSSQTSITSFHLQHWRAPLLWCPQLDKLWLCSTLTQSLPTQSSSSSKWGGYQADHHHEAESYLDGVRPCDWKNGSSK